MKHFSHDAEMTRRGALSHLAIGLGSAAVATSGALAHAAAYPDRPITVVTPFGGPTDALARLVAQNLAKRLGTPVIVDQRLGASGTIAMAYVARSAPDGYTLAMGTSTTLTSAPHLFKNPGYDPTKSFTYLGVIQTSRMVLEISPDLGVNSLQEFVAYARARPHKLNFGSAGVGNTQHLAAEQFNAVAGIDAVHVSYKTGPETDAAILGGTVQYALASVPSSLALIQSGRLKALAVTGKGRDPSLPNVATLSEAGFPALIPDQFFGFVAPANMPPAVTAAISKALQESISDPSFQETVRKSGAEPSTLSPDDFRRVATTHSQQWGELIRRLNITLQ